MQLKPKSNSVITTVWDQDTGTIKFTVLGVGDLVVDLTKLHEDVKVDALYHGVTQRVSDRAAMSRDTVTGKPASPQAKFDSMQEYVTHLESGSPDWKMSGGGFGGENSITLRAIAKVKGYDYATAEKFVALFAAKQFEGDTKKCLAYLRTGATVQEAILELRKAAMPAAAIDADKALTEEFGE